MKCKYIVVGAGLAGATIAERIASQLDQEVLVLEKRKHIAGNCYDFYNEHGLLVHKYGPHIFHTEDKSIWDYLSKFTEWRPYSPKVLSYVDGDYVPIPPNLDTFNILHGMNLTTDELIEFLRKETAHITKVKNSRDAIVCHAGEYIYERMFKNYTKKLWGVDAELLDPEVCSRIPIRYNNDSRYYDHKYQGLPKEGYTEMVQRMLDHPNIKIFLGYNFGRLSNVIKYETLFYTGSLDYFFDYKFKPLPYRTLDIKWATHNVEHYQLAVCIVYPNDYDFTRVVEYKYMTGQKSPVTTISREFPRNAEGLDERYYPMLTDEAKMKADIYRKEAEKLQPKVFFLGRLAEYRYYNMDQAVLRGLQVFEEIKKNA